MAFVSMSLSVSNSLLKLEKLCLQQLSFQPTKSRNEWFVWLLLCETKDLYVSKRYHWFPLVNEVAVSQFRGCSPRGTQPWWSMLAVSLKDHNAWTERSPKWDALVYRGFPVCVISCACPYPLTLLSPSNQLHFTREVNKMVTIQDGWIMEPEIVNFLIFFFFF